MATTYDKASLVMIPSGYKDDKLYSVKPTDGSGDFTFSRDGAGASPATRVNASGLIEKGRTNEVLQSNTFNTTWSLTRITLTSGQSGYDSSNNAWELSSTATSGQSSNILQNVSLSGVQTFSLYAKAGTASWFRILGDAATDYIAFFDLSGSGAVGTTSGEIDAQIVSVGGGWFRCSITANATISRVILNMAGGDNNVFPNTGDTIYIQDAQLEQGLVATAPAIETTTAAVSAGLLGDMPRLDYSGGATCPSLLLEPSRVNLFIQSEYFETAWSKANVTLTANDTSSPEGVTNAYKMEATGTGGKVIYEDVALTNGTFTISIFVKKGANTGLFSLSDGYSSTKLNVDLDAETATADNANTLSPFIEPFNDGWFRIGYSMAVTASQAQPALYLLDSSGNQNYTANGETIYIYGAQLELGSYPTSYIPTYGSASTRGADASEITGASAIIGQTEGTLFVELGDMNTNAADDVWFELSDGTTNNRILIYNDSIGDIRNQIKAGGTISSLIDTNVKLASNQKIAITYATNEAKVFVNGVQYGGTDTSVVVPATSQINFSNFTNTIAQSRTLKQALLFKTKLTDAECIALTA